MTSKVASLTVSTGNRNCCNAVLLDIKCFYKEIEATKFPQHFTKRKPRNKKNAKKQADCK